MLYNYSNGKEEAGHGIQPDTLGRRTLMQKTYDLDRFHRTQDGDFETALSEIRDGKKRSQWVWYIFPQLKSLGHSPMAER